jgi:hypothetical protein
VAQAHDDAALRARGDHELVGDRAVDDRERVVPRRAERLRHALVEAAVVVVDQRRLAVHELVGVGHRRAQCFGDGLVAEADTQQRGSGGECGADHGNRNPRRGRSSGTGREQHGVIVGDSSRDIRLGDIVVADDLGLGAQLSQVAVEGVDETVVVVDDEHAGH